MKVHIYCLKDPITFEIKYIGRTKNDLKSRLRGHIASSKRAKFKTRKQNWILNLISKNIKPIIEKLIEIEGWEESYLYEQSLIKEYVDKGFDLYNLKDRGIGSYLPCKKEVKDLISKKIKNLHEKGHYKNSSLLKKVTIYNLEGNKILSFNSIADCARFLNVNNKNLEVSLKRQSKRFHNYQIRKYEVDKIEPYTVNYAVNKQSMSLQNIEDNSTLYFSCKKDCCRFLNISFNTLVRKIKNKSIINNKYIVT